MMTPTWSLSPSPRDLNPHDYRPDIDGLRGISVLAVVIFHAFPGVLNAGFIGVDVFFVISGFLISSIIFRKLDAGTFSFANFYSRRVKRIFPSLLVVLAAVYLIGWGLLTDMEYQRLGKHIAAGAGFISNFVLWREAGYFDVASETKPLLHLWSLGIEEQFYIIWPVIVWAAWKNRRAVPFIIITVIVLSLGWSAIAAAIYQSAHFYSPLTRAWELGAGSLIAWCGLRGRASGIVQKSRMLPDVASSVGLALLGAGFLLIDKGVAYPGTSAIVPVLGAALLIQAGPRAIANRWILASKVLVWVGLISFPLYLWHWPLLSVMRIATGHPPDWSQQAMVVILALILAWATYVFVERPVRASGYASFKVAILASLMVGIGVVGLSTSYLWAGLPSRSVVRNSVIVERARGRGDSTVMSDCIVKDSEVRGRLANCNRDERGPSRYAVIGDSKAQSLYPGLVRTSSDAGRWLFIGGAGKGPSPIPVLSDAEAYSDFNSVTPAVLNAVARDPDIEVVALVAAARNILQVSDQSLNGNISTYDYKYTYKLNQTPLLNEARAGLDAAVSVLERAGKKVILVIDNPALPEPSDCIARKTSLDFVNKYLIDSNPECTQPLKNVIYYTKSYRALLYETQSKHSKNTYIFDPTDIYCDRIRGVCGASRDGKMLYAYSDHISDYAAGLVGEKLNDFLNTTVVRVTNKESQPGLATESD